MISIDLNCDLGETLNENSIVDENSIIPLISSANIACGFHSGNPHIMVNTIKTCLKYQVAVGAHPGFPDRKGFGRREMNFTTDEIARIVLYQIGALGALIKAEGGKMHHIKPHGALYNMAAKYQHVAKGIIKAILAYDDQLLVYGLSGSLLIDEGKKHGLTMVAEVFADRRYNDDGTLVNRTIPGAVMEVKEEINQQVLQIIRNQRVTTLSGKEIKLLGETICLHGDNPQAIEIAQNINNLLKTNGIKIYSIGTRS